MKLIVGLGNPGKEYEKTRHNFGSLVIDRLVKKYEAHLKDFKKQALAAKITLGGEETIIAKSLGFMNESGGPVAQLMHFHKMQPNDLIVIYDDIDLLYRTIRVSKNASSGGHKGVESVITSIGADFHRIRLGIGPQTKPAEEYVLEKINKEEKEKLSAIANKAIELIEEGITKGFEAVLGTYSV
ncbi:MAG: aminoacyl-tRNA hydrolase [Candidatus Komeilibacteria bacterium]|nr:aminoacyl-tRNA hydrolase [Candidatus Komeilibacteria bacterium]